MMNRALRGLLGSSSRRWSVSTATKNHDSAPLSAVLSSRRGPTGSNNNVGGGRAFVFASSFPTDVRDDRRVWKLDVETVVNKHASRTTFARRGPSLWNQTRRLVVDVGSGRSRSLSTKSGDDGDAGKDPSSSSSSSSSRRGPKGVRINFREDRDRAPPRRGTDDTSSSSSSSFSSDVPELPPSLQEPAGVLYDSNNLRVQNGRRGSDDGDAALFRRFVPQVALHPLDGRGATTRKRVLVLCAGGTLTMAPDVDADGALRPVEGALTSYMERMEELEDDLMPEVVVHEYRPLLDSSDAGPAEWATLASDVFVNYHHFDGFVVLMGTDTMAYAATALSFMLENLGKPVVFTGSQIPLAEPYNDARRNLVMALIFAGRDTVHEVCVFFHDRLLRACRTTKVDTHALKAFDSPNVDPLARIGVRIEENEALRRPPARGALRAHLRSDTRVVGLRLAPGLDDAALRRFVRSAAETELTALVLQLYGTGNLPSIKDGVLECLREATNAGVLVVASTQCAKGSVTMGYYATGRALADAGVVSASDMTLEAVTCKIGYLAGRGDLAPREVGNLMEVSLRGEVTPQEALPLPPLASAYERARTKGKQYY